MVQCYLALLLERWRLFFPHFRRHLRCDIDPAGRCITRVRGASHKRCHTRIDAILDARVEEMSGVEVYDPTSLWLGRGGVQCACEQLFEGGLVALQ